MVYVSACVCERTKRERERLSESIDMVLNVNLKRRLKSLTFNYGFEPRVLRKRSGHTCLK